MSRISSYVRSSARVAALLALVVPGAAFGQQSEPDPDLAYFIGTWEGEGVTDQGFYERTTYTWGGSQNSVRIDMRYGFPGSAEFVAHGFMGSEPGRGTFQQNLVMDTGTVFLMREIDREGSRIVLEATAYGASPFSNPFRVEFDKIDATHYESRAFSARDGAWVEVLHHQFRKVTD